MVLGPALGQSAILKQSQNQGLVMTPQMQQALKLLQLSNLELDEYLTLELEQNPLLENMKDSSTPDPAEPDSQNTEYNDNTSSEKNPPENSGSEESIQENSESNDLGGDTETRLNSEIKSEDDWQDQVLDNIPDPDEVYVSRQAASEETTSTTEILEQTISNSETLTESLENQIKLENLEENVKAVALSLVRWIDDDGYIRETEEELCSYLGVEPELLFNALLVVKSLEPIGIGACDLADCLRLQLKALKLHTGTHEKLLANLQLIEKGEVSRLLKICNIKQEDLQNIMAELRQCDPKPGRQFNQSDLQAKEPEIIIEKRPPSEISPHGWHSDLNENTLPKILFLDRYWEELSKRKMTENDKLFLQECHKSGKWLTQALQHRAATMLRVSRAIVNKQVDFFDRGVAHMVPMTMKDIAAELDLHESTISRVIANKLFSTPRGTFELKYFFTAGLRSTSGGSDYSAEAIRELIRQMINAEIPGKPISDTNLASELKNQKIEIARRTVAKYREHMKIPPASIRRIKTKMGVL